MKITIVHNFYAQKGGEDVVVENELSMLRSMGHQVSFVSAHNSSINTIADKFWTLAGTVYNLRAKKRFAQHISAFQPDIVHVHNFFPKLSPSIFDACAEAGIPSVMTLHNFRILCPTAFLYHSGRIEERSLHGSCWWAVREAVYRHSIVGSAIVAAMVQYHRAVGTWTRKVDAFIALTEFAKAIFVQGGLPSAKIFVKSNATYSSPDYSGPRLARRGALFVGRLSEEKGLSELVNAWKGIDHPLRIVGSGGLEDWIREAASGNANIELLGALTQHDVQLQMQRSEFLIVPSKWYEMFAMVVAEAFSCGLPVLASKLGGLAEIIQDGQTGIHISSLAPDGLARVIQWAFDHPNEMRAMGMNAKRAFEENYTQATNYKRLMEIYGSVISSRNSKLTLSEGSKNRDVST